MAMLSFKAAWAGRSFIAVNPAYTSQDCSACGHRQKMPLADRVYRCPCCGLELDRDYNASRNIRTLGLQGLGLWPLEAAGPSPVQSSHDRARWMHRKIEGRRPEARGAPGRPAMDDVTDLEEVTCLSCRLPTAP